MKFFITASDTDVGKSFVTASLLRAFLEQGAKAVALKPVQTGYIENSRIPNNNLAYESLEPDFKEYIKAGQNADFKATCYTFAYPASPHFSAELEGKQINKARILDFIEQNSDEITLIEGAGGIFVPLSESQSFLDIIKALNAPVILVCKNCLGAINHALLNLEILRFNNIKISALVLNFHNENNAICRSNLEFLEKKFPCPIITLEKLSKNDNYKNSAKFFKDFAEYLLKKSN